MSEARVQLRVLRFRFFQDGDVGVGVFPDGQEILISSFGLGGITFECVGAGEAEVGERASFARSCQSLVAEDLLKFDLCGRTIPGREQGLSTNISGVNATAENVIGELVGDAGLKDVERSIWIVS